MGCQTEIAALIRTLEGDYALALKKNQGRLYQEVERLFHDALTDPSRAIPYQTHQTVEKGHGRLEKRQCWTISQPDYIRYLDPQGRWAGLHSVVRLEYQRQLTGQATTQEVRYYLSSLDGDPERLNRVIRTHWTIENQLHWVLDVAFGEDDSRIRQGYAAENLAVVRHMALNLLKQEQCLKGSIQTKRLQAGWNNDYLLKALGLLT